MSAKQRLADLGLLIRRDRKVQIITAMILLAGLFLMFAGKGNRRYRQARPQQQSSVSTASAELYDDLKESVISRMDVMDANQKSMMQEMKEQQERVEQNELRTAEIFSTLIEQMNTQKESPSIVGGVGGGAIEDLPVPPDYSEGLESFGEVSDEGTVAPPPQAPEVERVAYVGKTDFVRVKLLAGVNAPTDGTPYPVIFKLVGDVQGPDNTALPLGEARLLAAAQGSLTDSRALFRLTNLSMRYPNGERVDIPVDGWIVGEDGLRGLQGAPIDPLGKVLGASAVAGVINGIGQGLRAQAVQTESTFFGTRETVNTGDLADFTLGEALRNPSNIWSNVIQERVSELIPAIQVYSGREATAVFSEQFTIPGLYELLEEGESDVYATLD